MENHHAIHGKIHYFDWAMFNSYVSHNQRVDLCGFSDAPAAKSFNQWIGLRENLQETIDFPMKYGAFLYFFP